MSSFRKPKRYAMEDDGSPPLWRLNQSRFSGVAGSVGSETTLTDVEIAIPAVSRTPHRHAGEAFERHAPDPGDAQPTPRAGKVYTGSPLVRDRPHDFDDSAGSGSSLRTVATSLARLRSEDFGCHTYLEDLDSLEAGAEEENAVICSLALHNYEVFHKMTPGSANLGSVQVSSAGIAGWARSTVG